MSTKINKAIEDMFIERLANILNEIGLDADDSKQFFTANNKFKTKGKHPKEKRKLKNISGYNLFAREMFPTVKVDNPDMKTTEHNKIIGNLWKEQTTDDTKKAYNEREKLISPVTKEKKTSKKITK